MKLGTTRPPTREIGEHSGGDADAHAIARAARQRAFHMEHRVADKEQADQQQHLEVAQVGLDTISRATTAARATRNKRSTTAAQGRPSQAEMATAKRPASQVSRRPSNGGPVTGSRPVQFGTAVSRKPATMAGR